MSKYKLHKLHQRHILKKGCPQWHICPPFQAHSVHSCAFLPIQDHLVARGVQPDTPLPLPHCQRSCYAFLWHHFLFTAHRVVCCETVVFLCFSRKCSSLLCISPSVNVCAPVSLFSGGCSDVGQSVFTVASLL